MPEFQSSPSRRLRSEQGTLNDAHESCVSGELRDERVALGNDHQHPVEKEVEWADYIPTTSIDQQRQNQLKVRRERAQLKRKNETEEQRQVRLENDRERVRSRRKNEATEQRQIRLDNERKRTESNRRNETEEEHQVRIENDQERTESNRRNETEQQRQIRLDQERKRSAENRKKANIRRYNFCATNSEQQGINTTFSERGKLEISVDDHLLDSIHQGNLSQQNSGSESPAWPAPISRDVKEVLLQKFLEQMSMSALQEATCAVCNVRVLVRKSKKFPVSKIPNSHLLQVSEELKDLIKRESQSKVQF
jgi:hypothetical protein